jgi:hypothetical protein
MHEDATGLFGARLAGGHTHIACCGKRRIAAADANGARLSAASAVTGLHVNLAGRSLLGVRAPD